LKRRGSWNLTLQGPFGQIMGYFSRHQIGNDKSASR
jgi:hypothetical protein